MQAPAASALGQSASVSDWKTSVKSGPEIDSSTSFLHPPPPLSFLPPSRKKKKKAKSSGRSAPNERPKGITHRRRRQLKPAPTNQTAAVDLISSLRRRTPKPIHLTVGGSNSTQSGQLPVLDARRTTSRASFQLNQLHGTRRSTTQAQTHTN